MTQDCVNAGNKIPHEINVIIEIPRSSEPIKYEMDKTSGSLFVTQFLTTSMHYPCNYGYIPQSLTQSGIPLPTLVITPIPVNRGCVIRSRPIGVLAMSDENGHDHKILALPCHELTGSYDHVDKIEDLPPLLLQQIAHFFMHYRDLEEDRIVKFEGWLDLAIAEKEILGCVARYENQHIKSCA